MVKIGIIGAAGYSGLELLNLLMDHPEAEIVKLFGHSTVGSRIEHVHTSLRGMISLEIEEISKKALTGLDLVYVALPSGQSTKVIADAYEAEIKIIDLGGDFRLNNITDYAKYYQHDHSAVNLLGVAVYGLSEWNEREISKAKLIANPGCYPTSILLPLIPLLEAEVIESNSVSIVSYSGASGAGKSLSQNMLYSEVNESVRAYKVGNHQHIPEIKQYLQKFSTKETTFSFVPHILPATRGIYTTIHAKLKNATAESKASNVFQNVYAEKPFIRLLAQEIPDLKDVHHTNFCDIAWKQIDNETLVVFSTIDNLVKGAAGQAIQNMNIMFGFDQTEGLLKCFKKNLLRAR
ncbi:MAG: N-acetyl-gamma-glutamyl-phosphate reductase [Ignavibacteria bacterium]|nr:MAG: N-acetyl-gamma-glutamyl-phosphate reductase [Ignavibacteria bacterium]KAF0160790.1 MAG: N-acetyl-gamma-glutamyl-phosphate reductase [Ignavibacteria bacterium]